MAASGQAMVDDDDWGIICQFSSEWRIDINPADSLVSIVHGQGSTITPEVWSTHIVPPSGSRRSCLFIVISASCHSVMDSLWSHKRSPSLPPSRVPHLPLIRYMVIHRKVCQCRINRLSMATSYSLVSLFYTCLLLYPNTYFGNHQLAVKPSFRLLHHLWTSSSVVSPWAPTSSLRVGPVIVMGA